MWTQFETRQNSFVLSEPSFQFPSFQYSSINIFETELSCLVANSVHTADTDKARQDSFVLSVSAVWTSYYALLCRFKYHALLTYIILHTARHISVSLIQWYYYNLHLCFCIFLFFCYATCILNIVYDGAWWNLGIIWVIVGWLVCELSHYTSVQCEFVFYMLLLSLLRCLFWYLYYIFALSLVIELRSGCCYAIFNSCISSLLSKKNYCFDQRCLCLGFRSYEWIFRYFWKTVFIETRSNRWDFRCNVDPGIYYGLLNWR